MRNIFSLKFNVWNQYNGLINSINQIERELMVCSDSQIAEKGYTLKKLCRLSDNRKQNLDSKTLIESFALVREASRRTLGLRHYDTQLLGGLILNDNKIAEMRTGEGKTLVATAPAFFNALDGKGVHIVTVNDYLAQRDAEWMGQIYRFLGLQVGLIQASMENPQRQKNYNRDITYVTNSELGFDFLRDNLAQNLDELVQRPFNYCIIDEVDSILIDEARTPLIISKPGKVELGKIIKANELINFLIKGKHFEVDEKLRNVSLTVAGVSRLEQLLKIESLYSVEDPWIPFILNAIRAKTLYKPFIHYLRKNEEIIIIDEFTGRAMEGRRWAEGLHNAIEAKEGIYNTQGSDTTASITYQSFFRLYPKIAGMTGTAKTEELEFEKIYNLTVSVLPTFKPIKRQDLDDLVFMDQIGKWKAIARECKKMYSIGRPVLVGTTTIQNSEILSSLLSRIEVPHQILNAKPENVNREAAIIAQAGCLSSITIATNMAGRGTDILLGGNAEYRTGQQTIFILETIVKNSQNEQLNQLNLIPEIKECIEELKSNKEELALLENDFVTLLNVINIPNKVLNRLERIVFKLYSALLIQNQEETKREKQKVISLGGLYVIGTERHESRRIDNQLRGRAGRQGDPGTTRFFLSLTDPLLRNFGGDQIKNLMQNFQMSEEALESKFLSNALEGAQQKVEGVYYDQRKTLNKYERIIEEQRSIIYHYRREILFAKTNRDLILDLGQSFVKSIAYELLTKQKNSSALTLEKTLATLNLSLEIGLDKVKYQNIETLTDVLYEQLWTLYSLKEQKFWYLDIRILRRFEKAILLRVIDNEWSLHLENLTFLRDSVSWSGYSQKNPLLVYEQQGFKLFTKMLQKSRDKIIAYLLDIDLV